jgi:hypothetical protein
VLGHLKKLQLAQGLEAEKARQLTLDHYIGQVGIASLDAALALAP